MLAVLQMRDGGERHARAGIENIVRKREFLESGQKGQRAAVGVPVHGAHRTRLVRSVHLQLHGWGGLEPDVAGNGIAAGGDLRIEHAQEDLEILRGQESAFLQEGIKHGEAGKMAEAFVERDASEPGVGKDFAVRKDVQTQRGPFAHKGEMQGKVVRDLALLRPARYFDVVIRAVHLTHHPHLFIITSQCLFYKKELPFSAFSQTQICAGNRAGFMLN